MLNPHYITGFVDGEGSFHVAIYRDSQMKFGIKIIPEFHVSQRENCQKILKDLVQYFKCGYLKKNHATKPNDKNVVYVVRNREDLLKKIIPFFEKYLLQTQKRGDFALFAKIVRLMESGRHSHKSGIQKILSYAYLMNQKGKYRRIKITL